MKEASTRDQEKERPKARRRDLEKAREASREENSNLPKVAVRQPQTVSTFALPSMAKVATKAPFSQENAAPKVIIFVASAAALAITVCNLVQSID